MAKNSDSYAVSRTNAMKFGVTVNRPMTCPGRERCRYRYCDDMSFEAPAGDLCPWEVSYAAALEAGYRRTYDYPAMRAQVDDFDEVIEALVANGLKRNRISLRSNRGCDLAGDDEARMRSWVEFKLCDRYMTACLRELERIVARFADALARIAEASEALRKLRTGMVFE